jgi:hypothetical protein
MDLLELREFTDRELTDVIESIRTNEDSSVVVERLQRLLDDVKSCHKQHSQKCRLDSQQLIGEDAVEHSRILHSGWLDLLVKNTSAAAAPRPATRIWCILNDQAEIQICAKPPALVNPARNGTMLTRVFAIRADLNCQLVCFG